MMGSRTAHAVSSRRGMLRAPLALICALVFGAQAQAQTSVRATASLSETRVAVGEPVEYRLEVTGARTASRPSHIPVEGLNITPVGQSSAFNYNPNTGLVASVTYIYQVDAAKPGTYTIPAQEFAAGGVTVKANAVTLTVTATADGRDGPAERLYFAELIIPKKNPYVGESIPAEIRCYFSPRIRFEPPMNPVIKGEGFTAQKVTEPQQDSVVVDGQNFQVIIYKTSITPLKTGPLAIGPVSADTRVLLPRPRPRSFGNSPFNDPFFNDPFGGFGTQKNVELRSEPVNLDVKALPPGAPASFTGAIGQFTLDAEAEPKQVNLGDPVTVRLTLRGRGNFDRINPPAPLDTNGWRAYPASGKFRPDDDVKLSGVKTFEQVFVPTEVKKLLPAYELAYLDPGSGQYRTLSSPALPISVIGPAVPAPTPTAPATSEARATEAPAKPVATPAPAKDILHIRTDGVGTGNFVPLYRRAAFWLPQAIAMALVLGALAAYRWRHRPGRALAERAMTERQRRDALAARLRDRGTRRRDFFLGAAGLAQARAADHCGREPSTLGGEEIISICGLDPASAETLRAIFRVRDEITFSGIDESAAVSDAERSAALGALAKLERSPAMATKT
ncbi:hypothetical protein AYO41_04430 [Verrucomicrobia bacterium SCGC AG-212-E04]|nr:hypothetical protein AYO41_04430 [Verrucomicrobia bacterium SCGC AG-212-E04]